MVGLRRRQHRPLISGASLLPLFLLLSLSTLGDAADDTLDCSKPISLEVGGAPRQFDLSSLAGVQVLNRQRGTPPTRMVDEVRFDLCADLPQKDGVAKSDQCASGTRACYTMVNQKDGESDRVIAAIPLALSSNLRPEFTALPSPRKGLNIILRGGDYPPEDDPVPQSLNISILCDTNQNEPKFVRYNGMQLVSEWSMPAGCAFSKDDPPPSGGSGGGKEEDSEGGGNDGGKDPEKVGSGIGWFFLLLLLAFIAYFAIGAYYNYSTYGASGADLIPHRDFWREVPYILRDITAHLCSAVRPSSRSGYIAV